MEQYRIDAITPSVYTMTVTAPGFSSKEVNALNVPASIITSQNVTLEVGAAEQTVSVEAAVAQLQTDSGDLSGTINAGEIAKVPINSLNPIDLVLTQPGVVSVENRDSYTNGSGFSANGLRPRANNFLIDGFDNNDQGIGGQALQPNNVEAIKEVTVLRNSYAPEFGRGGASVTNVIYKNGTNEFHGSLWERYTGSGLNALTSEEKRSGLTSKPRDVDNTFGFAAGGPVMHNKLFLFGSSQWHRIYGSETGNELTYPNSAGRSKSAGDCGGEPECQSPAEFAGRPDRSDCKPAPSMSGYAPGCGSPGSPCLIPIGQITRATTQQNPAYEFVVRADYQMSDKDTISGRYIGTQSTLTPDLFANPRRPCLLRIRSRADPRAILGAFWTHVSARHAVNEARFTFQQIDFQFGLLSAAATSLGPNLTSPGFAGTVLRRHRLGFSSRAAATTHTAIRTRFHGRWEATVSRRARISIIWLLTTRFRLTRAAPISYAGGGSCAAIGLATCTGLANFLDDFTGPSGNAGRQFGSPNVDFGQTTQAYYIQDAWKILPTFTMTYGVRYEYFSTPFNFLKYPAVNAGDCPDRSDHDRGEAEGGYE